VGHQSLTQSVDEMLDLCVYGVQYVIVGEEHFVHVWNAAGAMQFVCTLNLHSTSGFPLAVSQTRNLVATVSTIHTAVKVSVITYSLSIALADCVNTKMHTTVVAKIHDSCTYSGNKAYSPKLYIHWLQ